MRRDMSLPGVNVVWTEFCTYMIPFPVGCKYRLGSFRSLWVCIFYLLFGKFKKLGITRRFIHGFFFVLSEDQNGTV